MGKKLGPEEDVTHIKEQRAFSELTLVAEIARYLNLSPLRIREVLAGSQQGISKILEAVNTFNELLYDWIIHRLFGEFFELQEFKAEDDIEVELVKTRDNPHLRSVHAPPTDAGSMGLPVSEDPGVLATFYFKSDPDLIVHKTDARLGDFMGKSFHLDAYCFDSQPERELFLRLLRDQEVDKVWFTGMLTHGQSDFVVHYVDPLSHTVRSYYPDFLVQQRDGSYVIIEVKGDNMVDDTVVRAKAEYAAQLAYASRMTYRMVKGSEVMAGRGWG